MDSLIKLLAWMGAPPVFSSGFMNILAESSNCAPNPSFPQPHFVRARRDKTGRELPQVIAHRGYKAKFPENTMLAFKGAVEAGSHALETDVHLTRDGVVVLSHDATLKRCFGVDKKVIDCDWEYISELRTLQQPHEPMPRLLDLVEYLAQPATAQIWLLLDIKLDNKANDIMGQMAKVFEKIPSLVGTSWKDRVLLGFWAAKYVPLCEEYFPGFSLVNIGFSVPYSGQFLAIGGVGFNILQASLVSPFGRSFIKDAKAAERRVLSWTVNDEKDMDWCIRRKLDGVVTDDPKKYLELQDRFTESKRAPAWSATQIRSMLRINIMLWIFTFIYGRKHGFGLDKRFIYKNL